MADDKGVNIQPYWVRRLVVAEPSHRTAPHVFKEVTVYKIEHRDDGETLYIELEDRYE